MCFGRVLRTRAWATTSMCSAGLRFPSVLHLGKFGDRLFGQRIETSAAFSEMRENFGAHPRVPELDDVAGYAGNAILVRLDGKEFADLVGHMDEFVRRHGGTFRLPIVRDG